MRECQQITLMVKTKAAGDTCHVRWENRRIGLHRMHKGDEEKEEEERRLEKRLLLLCVLLLSSLPLVIRKIDDEEEHKRVRR